MIEPPLHIDPDNPEFKKALQLLKLTDTNIFLTGKAGTGKSTFLRYVCKHINKKHVVLAPTGVAAVNVGGMTIHSFFQMPLRPVPPDDQNYSVSAIKKSGKLSKQKRKLIQQLDLIIIDEVSMVRPDMIDFIDRTLRAITGKRGVPFGGIQLLLVGDIFQLEPVVTSDTRAILQRYYSDFFFFNALAYQKANLVSIELKKIYRQTDTQFIDLLDRIRINKATTEDFRILNSRVNSDGDSITDDNTAFGITLAARKDGAAMINKEKMDALPSEEIIFEGKIDDDFPEKLLPTDYELVLKKDAQVMMIRNDKDRRWVNGTLAKIVELTPDKITIELENGKREDVDKETWENISYVYDEKEKKVKEDVLGQFTQYPLKAAWALTIHKSQGLTFNNVTIDMGGGAFSAGQTYVALSRCRSLEGLCFINPLKKYDVIVSHGASEFSKSYNDTDTFENALKNAKAKELSKLAISEYTNGNICDAVERIWEIHTLTGSLALAGVRRFISKILGEVNKLRKEIANKNNIIKQLSDEFVKTGITLLDDYCAPQEALKHFSKAYKLNDDNDKATFMMAVCHSELGDDKKSEKLLDKLIRKKSKMSYEVLMMKGSIKEKARDSSGAVLNFLAAAKLKPEEEEPVRKVVNMYENFGMYDLADQYRSSLKSDNSNLTN